MDLDIDKPCLFKTWLQMLPTPTQTFLIEQFFRTFSKLNRISNTSTEKETAKPTPHWVYLEISTTFRDTVIIPGNHIGFRHLHPSTGFQNPKNVFHVTVPLFSLDAAIQHAGVDKIELALIHKFQVFQQIAQLKSAIGRFIWRTDW
jgi:hypothetical protein